MSSACDLSPVGCVCGEKESIRRELRSLLDEVKRRHPGVSESITAALGNVNPYTLCDPGALQGGRRRAARLRERRSRAERCGVNAPPSDAVQEDRSTHTTWRETP